MNEWINLDICKHPQNLLDMLDFFNCKHIASQKCFSYALDIGYSLYSLHKFSQNIINKYFISQEEILGFSTTTHCNYLSNLTTIHYNKR
jgi:hypothetical protein